MMSEHMAFPRHALPAALPSVFLAQALNASHYLDGRELHLNPATPEKIETEPDGSEPMKRLFVGDLPHSVGEAELRAVFEPYGEVEDVIIMKNPETARGSPLQCAPRSSMPRSFVSSTRFMHAHVPALRAPERSTSAPLRQTGSRPVSVVCPSGSLV